MKHNIIIRHLDSAALILFGIATILSGCKSEEDALLEPKVYFEQQEVEISYEVQEELSQDLRARLSTMSEQDVTVGFTIGGQELIDEYNRQNGTDFLGLAPATIVLDNPTATIPRGSLYSDPISVQITELEQIKDGKSYLVPIAIQSSTLPTISSTSVTYLKITKPIRIMKAWKLSSDYIRIPLPLDQPFTSVTYEALIRFDRLGGNNTIMGREGILILRVGDPALPGGANNLIQIAGAKQFHSDKTKFVPGQWYHVAFTYDEGSGKATIYVNGEKEAESDWIGSSFDIAPEMFVGKVAGFMWGERPFSGLMSEVRLWSVARTQTQIQKSMLSVDPESDGLVAYYHLNGDDLTENDKGQKVVIDASGHGMDGLMNGGQGRYNVSALEAPIAIGK